MKVPIDRAFLTDIIKIDTQTVTNLQIQEILNDWRQFLNIITDEKGKDKYTFYHKSFLDFLASDKLIQAIGDDYPKKAKSLKLKYYKSISDEALGKNA